MRETIETLIDHYGFELRGYTASELVGRWLARYEANWVRLAAIEALYQGRYKAVSVEHILDAWQRRGRPHHRFNHDFERLICRNLPRDFAGDRASDGESSPVEVPDSQVLDVEDPPETAAESEPSLASWNWEAGEGSRSARNDSEQTAIDQFTPPPDVSTFYIKLKAVAQQGQQLFSGTSEPETPEQERVRSGQDA